MSYLNIEERRGALYCDITPETLGLKTHTDGFNLSIFYGYNVWNNLGAEFESIAKSTCPVRTGYLRDHIGYKADEGGVEVWSDAPYSAQQEYSSNNSFFEAALQQAVNSAMDDLNAIELAYDIQDSYLSNIGERITGSSQQLASYLQKVDTCISGFNSLNSFIVSNGGTPYSLARLYSIRSQIENRIIYLRYLEGQQALAASGSRKSSPGSSFLSSFAVLFGKLIAMVISSVIEVPSDIAGEGAEGHHSPSHN